MVGPLRALSVLLIVSGAAIGAGCTTGPPPSSGTETQPEVVVESVADEDWVAEVPDYEKANYSELTDAQQAEFTRAMRGSTTAGPLAYSNYRFVEYRGEWYEVLLIEH